MFASSHTGEPPRPAPPDDRAVPPHLRRARRAQIAFTTALVVAVAASIVGAWYLGRNSGLRLSTAATPLEPSVLSAEVQEGPLIDNLVIRGEAGYEATTLLASGGSGRITKEDVGQYVVEGVPFIEVDGAPVVPLIGDRPMWRDLTTGSRGSDVLQLEQALQRLGYDPGTVDERFTTQTAKAWSDHLAALGYASSTTPSIAVANVLFLPDASPVRLLDVPLAVGEYVSPGTVLAEVTTRPIEVRANLSDDQRAVLAPGQAASLHDEASQTSYSGTIRDIANNAGQWMAIIDMPGEQPPAGALLQVTIELARSGTDDVVLPSSAVQARPDGEGYVVVVDASGETVRTVDIEVTVAAGGRVAVRGDIHPGELVTVGPPQ